MAERGSGMSRFSAGQVSGVVDDGDEQRSAGASVEDAHDEGAVHDQLLEGDVGARSSWYRESPFVPIRLTCVARILVECEACEVIPFIPRLHANGVAAVCREWDGVPMARLNRPSVVAARLERLVQSRYARVKLLGLPRSSVTGFVQGYLAQVGVLPQFRRRGIARQLVDHASKASGAQRLDLATDDAQAFYESFTHKAKAGFRIYPSTPRT